MRTSYDKKVSYYDQVEIREWGIFEIEGKCPDICDHLQLAWGHVQGLGEGPHARWNSEAGFSNLGGPER